MDFNRWWLQDPEEIYWLEITDRADVGTDLNAPQRRDDGDEYYGYSLIGEVRDGDIVFHYHKDRKAIIAWSVASGQVWQDQVVWGAHGTVARNAGVRPYLRAGWRLGLNGTQPLEPEVPLDVLRAMQDNVQAVRDGLEGQYGKPVYFPFEPPAKRDLRPTQAYLTKLPLGVVRLLPSLQNAARTGRTLRTAQTFATVTEISEPAKPSPLGTAYRQADEDVAVSERDPFEVDPALVERANRTHAATQNALARYLVDKGLEPRSPIPGEPNYDLAWAVEGMVYVAEVKSLTNENEEKQMRLGLGQVLRYRHILSRKSPTRALLIVEREPSDSSWTELCCELDVELAWPDVFSRIHPLSV